MGRCWAPRRRTPWRGRTGADRFVHARPAVTAVPHSPGTASALLPLVSGPRRAGSGGQSGCSRAGTRRKPDRLRAVAEAPRRYVTVEGELEPLRSIRYRSVNFDSMEALKLRT